MSSESINSVDELLDDNSIAQVNHHLEPFHIATNPPHFRILYCLYCVEKASADVLNNNLTLTEETISQTAKILVNHGLIRHWEYGSDADQDGYYYELSPTGKHVMSALTQYFQSDDS